MPRTVIYGSSKYRLLHPSYDGLVSVVASSSPGPMRSSRVSVACWRRTRYFEEEPWKTCRRKRIDCASGSDLQEGRTTTDYTWSSIMRFLAEQANERETHYVLLVGSFAIMHELDECMIRQNRNIVSTKNTKRNYYT